GDGDGVTAENEFHHAVRNVQRRKTAARHAGSADEKRVHEKINLCYAHSEEAGEHQARDVADAGVGKRETEIEAHAFADQLGHENQKLERATDEDADGKRDGGALEVAPDHGGGKDDDGKVEEGGGGSGKGKIVEGVEN